MLITEIKGIGEKSQKLFNKIGIVNVEDLLEYYPRSYDTFEEPVMIQDIEEPGIYAIYAQVSSNVEIIKKGSLTIINVELRDYNGDVIKAVWFNMPFLKTTLKRGNKLVFRGRIIFKAGKVQFEHPLIYKYADYEDKLSIMQPIYPLTEGLTNNLLVKSMKQAMELVDICHEYMPFEIRQEYKLMDYSEAVKKIHFPHNMTEYIRARNRIVFDEFFMFILALKEMKASNQVATTDFIIPNDKRTDEFQQKLPFKLTNGQKDVWNQVRDDLNSTKQMNRLIQGDVGSGKTIVALLALLDTVFAGFQGAMMVPTEVLAIQQYESVKKMLENSLPHIKIGLLIGSMTAKEKRLTYEGLLDGSIQIIIGTNAIIQEKAVYKNLGLVITDEQHRFGVNQRKTLSEKGAFPNCIVMSATPIPRTLGIILYGDLDISIINELPANRLPIKNCVVDESYRPKAYNFIEQEINSNRQVYIICPLVEESESTEAENVMDYSSKIKEQFPQFNVGYLHGKMKPAEKNKVMDDFSKGIIQILVSTTVVEVGVNVPNATVMMIENADRFGLAQLHQLRGRVGRGAHQSYCIMISNSKKKETKERLEIMNKSNDGFFIASEDLKHRGPGDFFGIRQSGDFAFGLGDIFNDATQLQEASICVDAYMNNKYNISSGEKKVIDQKLGAYTRKCLNKLNI